MGWTLLSAAFDVDLWVAFDFVPLATEADKSVRPTWPIRIQLRDAPLPLSVCLRRAFGKLQV